MFNRFILMCYGESNIILNFYTHSYIIFKAITITNNWSYKKKSIQLDSFIHFLFISNEYRIHGCNTFLLLELVCNTLTNFSLFIASCNRIVCEIKYKIILGKLFLHVRS